MLLAVATQTPRVHHHHPNNCLVLDHVNLNHERGRHDLVDAFYFDVLGLVADPRKAANLEAGQGTVWANCGMHQFHLSEGARAQVLDGKVTLGYASLAGVRERLRSSSSARLLRERSACFNYSPSSSGSLLRVTDPWGTAFELVELADDDVEDTRGSQPNGRAAEARALLDVSINVPRVAPSRFAGIGAR